MLLSLAVFYKNKKVYIPSNFICPKKSVEASIEDAAREFHPDSSGPRSPNPHNAKLSWFLRLECLGYALYRDHRPHNYFFYFLKGWLRKHLTFFLNIIQIKSSEMFSLNPMDILKSTSELL